MGVLRQRFHDGGVCIMNPASADQIEWTGSRSIRGQFQFHPMIARDALVFAFVEVP
jgi:hypothetical protein